MQFANSIDFTKLSKEDILAFLHQHHLNLSVDEILTIQQTLLKRPPTFAECVLWSIQGSEHCSYKSTRQHLKQFVTESPQVILGPKEDAGIVAVATDHTGMRYGIVVSHESHNHPSQLVPYEGAATGVGGNVRDVSCMGAEVIAIADSLRFGDLQRAKTHFIHEGVVSGIAGYGNPLGVPNIAGDLYYDAGYNDNCLVTVVTLGVVREDHVIHSRAPQLNETLFFILVGKATDNSGFGGASFASQTFEHQSNTQQKGAVQEPNAFLGRHLLKANTALFEWLQANKQLHRVGFKDLGAGGIACASVELAESGGIGAEIDLNAVPTSIAGLPSEVILCAETQERFMWVVPQDLVEPILKHYNETFALPTLSQGACATCIGKSRSDGLYVVHDNEQKIVSAKASHITRGLVYERPYQIPVMQVVEPILPEPTDYHAVLLQLLAHENIASRAAIFERYDKQVQGRTVVEAGEADSGVIQPFNDPQYPEAIREVGVALSVDHNPRYNRLDAYWGAVNAVFESIRNVIAVGAFPVCITDCLCFGDPEKPEEMGALVAAVRGISEACRAVTLYDYPEATLPVIAGNVSLYNCSVQGAIPGSPIISCIGVLPTVTQVVTMSLKAAHHALILVGERRDECGGSIYYQLHQQWGAFVPKPDFILFNRTIHALHAATRAHYILAAHDIAEGGLAVTLAEMSFKHHIGVSIQVTSDLPTEKVLFSETGGFVLEVAYDKLKPFEQLMQTHQVPFAVIGETIIEPRLRMNQVIDLPIVDAQNAWVNGLREKLN